MTTAPSVLEWILASSEPAARWMAHAHLLDGTDHARLAATERAAVRADPATQSLIARLPEWETAAELSGHQSRRFAPNLLGLLADMGMAGGDDERIEHLLDAMLGRQDIQKRRQKRPHPETVEARKEVVFLVPPAKSPDAAKRILVGTGWVRVRGRIGPSPSLFPGKLAGKVHSTRRNPSSV